MRTALVSPIALTVLLGLVASARCARAAQGLSDDGKFFSADAIRSAEEVINAIQVAHQKDLRIDTIDRIPSELLPEYQQLGKQQFFQKWTNVRAVKQNIDGVYILICRDPGHLQVWVGNNTARRLFTAGDRDFLAHKLLTRFRQHEYNQGLLDTVHFVQRQMDDRSNATEDPKQPLLLLPLPPGEGRGEGKPGKTFEHQSHALAIPPHPNPLRGQEGMNAPFAGTSVGDHP